MSEGRVERRLAAILVADVAGYSRLIGADEEGTLAQLRAIRRREVRPFLVCPCALHSLPPTRDGQEQAVRVISADYRSVPR